MPGKATHSPHTHLPRAGSPGPAVCQSTHNGQNPEKIDVPARLGQF